jgi:hypothetical protein
MALFQVVCLVIVAPIIEAARISYHGAAVNITAAQCNEIVQGSTLREGWRKGCKCAAKDTMFCGEEALSPKVRKFEPSNVPSEIKECPSVPYCDTQARIPTEVEKEEEQEAEELDFGGADVKEIDGKTMKCCCASNVAGDATKSTFVVCQLKEGTVGCKNLVGPYYHSYNNMGSKYSKLQNFGKCMIYDSLGFDEASGSE